MMIKSLFNQTKKKFKTILVNTPFIKNYFESRTSYNYWINQKAWRVKDIFQDRALKQEDFIKKQYLPLLNKKDVICDYACACGDFAFIVAPYVKKIEGFDLSPHMINLAKQTAKDKNIENVYFYQIDACNHVFKEKYDHFMCLGLFTCIINDKIVVDIIKKIANATKSNGYLIVKDTLTINDKDVFYNDFNTLYSAIYRSKNKYVKFFKENGFDLVEEIKLSEINENKLFSIGAIFKKTK